MEIVTIVLFSVLGAVLSVALSCLPGLHIYGVLALCIVAASRFSSLPAVILVPLYAGLMIGYAVAGVIPSVLMSAPDESAFFAASPGRKYLKCGRGYEAVMLMGIGALAGLCWVCLAFAITPPFFVGVLVTVLRPHMHWIVWSVICFMLLSEWPRGGRYAYGARSRLADAWCPLFAGLVTFLLSGSLGLLLFFRSPIRLEGAFQNLMPAFAGLFTMPWLLLNVAGSGDTPAQELKMTPVDSVPLCSGVFAGLAGGSLAALLPGITGGVGGFLAGHATALRDEKAFLVSQGASRTVYYIGSFVLFFLPAMSLTRGGAACMIQGVYRPESFQDYYMILGAVAAAGSVSLLMLDPAARLSVRLVRYISCRGVSALGAAVVTAMVIGFTGGQGLLVTFAALCIGMIPVLYGSRRMNCLGVILLPMAVLL